MADLPTAVVSGLFSLAATLGSVWLKDRLERGRAANAKTLPSTADRPRSGTAALGYPAKLRVPAVVVGAFLVGVLFTATESNPSNVIPMALIGILVAMVLASVVFHARKGSGRGLKWFQLEVVALWAAHVSGWSLAAYLSDLSLVTIAISGELLTFSFGGWVASAVVGGLLILAWRRLVAV